MKLIITILLTLLITIPPTTISAAEFTIDSRSALHFGISTIIGAGLNQALIAGDAGQKGRIIFSGVNCIAIGAIKEFAIDYYPDYGDLAFNVLGCAIGIGLTEGIAIRANKKTIELEIQF